jgi:hypothetical protein
MPRYTRGFRDDLDALEHFERHGELLGADTVQRYVEMADTFLGTPLADLPGIEECQRPSRDWVRYNVATMEFAAMSEDRSTIFTYFIAEPRRLRGRTFREYCDDQCRRRWDRE